MSVATQIGFKRNYGAFFTQCGGIIAEGLAKQLASLSATQTFLAISVRHARMAATSLKLAAKVGLAGGAVYWTVQQGLWGTAEEGAAAGKKFAAAVMPSTVEYLDKIPSFARVNEAAIKNWNAGLKTTFESLSSAPESVNKYVGKAKDAVSNLGKSD